MIDFSEMNDAELNTVMTTASALLSKRRQDRETQEYKIKQESIKVANARLADINTQLDNLFREVGEICEQFNRNDCVEFYYSLPAGASVQYSAVDGWFSSTY